MFQTYRHIRTDADRGVLVITLAIESLQDYEVAKEVETELATAFSAAETDRVALDVGQLEFLASVGFWPFIGLYHKVKERDGKLVLCNVSNLVEQVLTRTQLLVNPSNTSALFQKADSVDEAIKKLNEA